MVQAVYEDTPMDTLRWLVEQGAPLGPEDEVIRVVASAVHEGNMDPQTAAWLQGVAAAGRGQAGGRGAGGRGLMGSVGCARKGQKRVRKLLRRLRKGTWRHGAADAQMVNAGNT